jgi:hypothetical protein
MKIKNGNLPRSNYSPCACNPSAEDRLGNGVPETVQRPARKVYECEEITPKMKMTTKGYKVVEMSRMEEEEY